MAVNAGQVDAALRHVYTAAGTTLTIGVALAVVPQDQVQPFLAALHQIGDGLQQVFGGATKIGVIVGPIIVGLMAKFAATSASFKNQLKSVTAQASEPENVEAKKEMVSATASIPEVSKVVAPTIAADVPSEKVVTH